MSQIGLPLIGASSSEVSVPQNAVVPQNAAVAQLRAKLQEELRRLEEGRFARGRRGEREGIPLGDLWGELFAGELPRGSLIEWLQGEPGGGAGTVALLAAKQVLAEKMLAVIDREEIFYPPAAAAWGIDLRRLVLIRPASSEDALWAFDQTLRSRGFGAAWSFCDRLDSRVFRRLQLAAEEGECFGMLIRPARAAKEPSFADWKFLVRPLIPGKRWQIEILRCRGALRRRPPFLLSLD